LYHGTLAEYDADVQLNAGKFDCQCRTLLSGVQVNAALFDPFVCGHSSCVHHSNAAFDGDFKVLSRFFARNSKTIVLINCDRFAFRSVDEDERAFALGMQFVLFRLFGYIPSPILFGNVIDSTCLLWKANCGRQGGFCLLYNIEHFRLR
jgi:hypothetical protein